MGTVIMIASGKGGCGKTTFAVNLGCAMASQGKTTLLLDMNIGLRNLDIYTGLQDKVIFDLGDFLTGTCRLSKVIVADDEHPGLFLLSSPQFRGIEGLTDQHIRLLCSKLASSFDCVIIDSPPGIGTDFCKLAAGVDKALIVLTQDYVALRNSDTVNKRLESLGVEDLYYAINRVNPIFWGSEGVPDAEKIAEVMKTALVGIVPEDPAIHLGNNTGRPAAADSGSYVRQTFLDIASRLME